MGRYILKKNKKLTVDVTTDMKCFYCKNKLEAKKVPYTINRSGFDMILRDVPAFVCRECGEVLFQEKSVKQIQSIIQDMDQRMSAIREMPSPSVASLSI